MRETIASLTDSQRAFLKEIVLYIRNHGVPPTTREIQRILGLKSPRSVSQYLGALEQAGYIRRGNGARNIRVVSTAEVDLPDVGTTIRVPIVGSAPCGLPLLAEQNITGYIRVSTKLARPPHQYFILKAVGDSMDRADIHDQDMVLVRQQQVAENGRVVVALIDDEATIKRLRIGRGHITLEPQSNNSVHRPIVLERDFRIQGEVIQPLRDLQE
jgi:repressor LexA